MKYDAEPISCEDFRWKACVYDKPSALIPLQPKRRESIGKLADNFQDVLLSKNYRVSVLSNYKDLNLSRRTPKIQAAMSA